jgi:hypothetical protein
MKIPKCRLANRVGEHFVWKSAKMNGNKETVYVPVDRDNRYTSKLKWALLFGETFMDEAHVSDVWIKVMVIFSLCPTPRNEGILGAWT